MGVLELLWNMPQSLRRTERAPDNPWNAWTLEWATSSPPPPENFVGTLPPVASPRPLWDLQHGVTAAPPRPGRALSWRAPMVGIGAFIFSEATFFGALIVAFLEYRVRSTGFGARDLDLPRTAIFSVFLFSSSLTVYLAEKRLHRDNQRGFLTFWLLTMLLGAVFLIGQVSEYVKMYADGITISTNLFTTAFFTLTGFHGLHVLVGLIALGVIALLARAGDFRGGRRGVAVDAVSIYWHFVDGVWVVVFSLVYLLGWVA
jgi:heme/copper-type cytochrome/quinol oxidase subunit 3